MSPAKCKPRYQSFFPIFLRSANIPNDAICTSFCFFLIALWRPWPLRGYLSGCRSGYCSGPLHGLFAFLLLAHPRVPMTQGLSFQNTDLILPYPCSKTFSDSQLHNNPFQTPHPKLIDSELDPCLLPFCSYPLPPLHVFLMGPKLSCPMPLLKFLPLPTMSFPSCLNLAMICQGLVQNTPFHQFFPKHSYNPFFLMIFPNMLFALIIVYTTNCAVLELFL